MTLPVLNLKDKDGNGFQPNVPDKVGYPEYPAITKEWGIEWIAPDDGWVKISGGIKTGYADIGVSIGGVVHFIGGSQSATEVYVGQFNPVKKGDAVKATGGFVSQSIAFLPNRTALDGGGA